MISKLFFVTYRILFLYITFIEYLEMFVYYFFMGLVEVGTFVMWDIDRIGFCRVGSIDVETYQGGPYLPLVAYRYIASFESKESESW